MYMQCGQAMCLENKMTILKENTMPYIDFVKEDRFDEMEALSRSLFGEKWDCYDCELWEQGKEDGSCIHYINNTCPCGYHDKDDNIKE